MSEVRILGAILGFLTIGLIPAQRVWAESGQKRYIVRLKEGESTNPFAKRIVRDANVEYLAEELEDSNLKSRELENLGIVVTQGDDYEVESRLNSHPLVDYYEEERTWDLASLSGVDLPSETNISPWLSDVLGLDEASPDPAVSNSYGDSVVVAVIDSGLRTSHPYITSALAINNVESGGAGGVDDDGNGYVDDIYGANVYSRDGNIAENGTDHGSHVAGIIKTIRDQAISDYPVAQKVEVLPIRFINSSGYGTTTGAVLAMEYAASRGARVVNASWGSLGVAAFSQALYDSMVELYNRDIVMLAAAGNASGGRTNNNDSIPYFPAGYNIPALLSVGSLTPVYSSNVFQRIEYSSFSNYGPQTVHVAAPGSFKESEYFDYGILSLNANYSSSFDYFVKKKGTSMAAPVVAGVAAVVRAINPSLNNYDVRNLIYNNSIRHSAMSVVSSQGYIHAGNTFSAAGGATSSGSRPGVTLPRFFSTDPDAAARAVASATTGGGGGSGGDVGGCGAILLIDGFDNNDQGPFAGNSLGLLASIYFLYFFLGRLRRQRVLLKVS